MKKNFISKYFAQVLMAFILIASVHGGFAQGSTGGTYITWDNQVGCIEYDSEGNPNDIRKGYALFEDIDESVCIRTCERSRVNYTVHGTNIIQVDWSVTGGQITGYSGSGNTTANISWGNFGNGAITVTVYYGDNTQTTTSLCIEKIRGPRANFDVYSNSPEASFCLDTPINFQNLSIDNGGSEIVYYQWDFGDDVNFSNAFEPVHSYDQPGEYKVTLTVTNKCNCSSRYSMTIRIIERPYIEINCASVVCETGKEEIYTVDDDCGGQWEVTGGSIVGTEGNNGIRVVWDNVGPDGFGYVHYRSECTCPFWTTVKIPVILRNGQIDGEATICVGEQNIYTLPQWPSTVFNWTLSGAGSGANLIFNDQRNQVIVEGVQPGTYQLECVYTNTLLGCSGTAKMRINVLQGTEILPGNEELCSGTSATYTTSSVAVVNWQLHKNNSLVASATGNSFTYSFPQGGVYTLTATAQGGCAGDPKVINVTQTPATPTGLIDGEILVCPGETYTYTYNNTVPGTVLVWETDADAVIQGSNAGSTVTVVFNDIPSGQHFVRVKRQSLDGLGCQSGFLTLNVNQIQINPTITNNDGLSIFCPSSETSFTVDLNGITPEFLEWSIVTANFGNITGGVNASTVNVSWNEISNGNDSDILRLRVRICGEDHFYDTPVTLLETPTISLTGPTNVCYGGDLNFTLNASPALTSGTVTWDFGNGTTTTTPISPNSQYTLQNPYNNTTGSEINQTVTATVNLPNGCNYEISANQSVIVYPRTVITVTPGYNYTVCPSSYSPIQLNANAVTGVGVTVSYQWFKNGGLIAGATANTYSISGGAPGGTYFVKVTDSNGCVVQSQNINVTENCTPPNPCSLSFDPDVVLTADWSGCNSVTAQISYNGTASVQWVGSPFLTFNGGNNNGAQFSSVIAGSHLITAYVTYQTPSGPCTVVENVEVIKHYEPNFNTVVTCDTSNGTYDVTLLNNSSVFNLTSPVTYTFSGTGMTPQTGETINLSNLSPGTYNFTLSLSMAGEPSCSITKTVVLDAMPNVSFALSPNNYCAEEPIALTIPNYNPNYTYYWEFFGTGYYASGPTTMININTGGTYGITLRATTPQGCDVTSNPVFVNINEAIYNGSLQVSPNNNVCEGDTPAPVISFSPSAGNPAMPDSYIWMKGGQQITTTQANAFTPTQSGNYWAILLDANGCRFNELPPVSVIIRTRPYAGITGNNNICPGEEATLKGIIAGTGLERRWLVDGVPVAGVYGNWSTSTPLTITVPSGTPGTFEYTFEVRPVNDAGCGSSASMDVTVNPAAPQPLLSYSVDTCEPYRVILTASGPSQGVYNWSSGDTGQSIEVTYGGAFNVIYTAPTGCQSSASITVPHPADRSLWVVPSGCYDVCLNSNPAPYLIGALGVFDSYNWVRNGVNVAAGTNSNIFDLPVSMAGTYQLLVSNDGCDYESNILNVAPNLEECEIVSCELDIKIDKIWYEGGIYYLAGGIGNPSGSPITVTIISFNNYGTYSPNPITIPANSFYSFQPLYFYPNSNFTGGEDFFVVQMEGCMSIREIKYPAIEGMAHREIGQPATLNIVPNPAESYTVVTYDLGDEYTDAESLTVFNMLGTPLLTQKLDKASGSVNINTTILPSGTYIVSIQAQGRRVLQSALVKK